MKTKKSLCLLMLLATLSIAHAEAKYWPTIKKNILEYDEAKGREAKDTVEAKGREYLSSLSINQLIEAGRECSQEADATDPGTTYCKEYLYLISFFGEQYHASGGLNNLELVFKEIEDKTQTNLWRATLIDLLASNKWMKLLNDEQRYTAINRLNPVLIDKLEPFELRFCACKSISNILNNLENNYLLTEPIVQNRIQNGDKLQKLKEEVANGQLKLSDNYRKNIARLMNSYNDYSQALLSVIDEPNLNPALSRIVLIGMRRSLSKGNPSIQQLKERLEKAVRSYKQFDQGATWRLLANISYEILAPQDADILVDSMCNNLSSKKESKNGKKERNQLISEINSLKYIIKKHKKK